MSNMEVLELSNCSFTIRKLMVEIEYCRYCASILYLLNSCSHEYRKRLQKLKFIAKGNETTLLVVIRQSRYVMRCAKQQALNSWWQIFIARTKYFKQNLHESARTTWCTHFIKNIVDLLAPPYRL